MSEYNDLAADLEHKLRLSFSDYPIRIKVLRDWEMKQRDLDYDNTMSLVAFVPFKYLDPDLHAPQDCMIREDAERIFKVSNLFSIELVRDEHFDIGKYFKEIVLEAVGIHFAQEQESRKTNPDDYLWILAGACITDNCECRKYHLLPLSIIGKHPPAHDGCTCYAKKRW